jgi:tight adherence protein B
VHAIRARVRGRSRARRLLTSRLLPVDRPGQPGRPVGGSVATSRSLGDPETGSTGTGLPSRIASRVALALATRRLRIALILLASALVALAGGGALAVAAAALLWCAARLVADGAARRATRRRERSVDLAVRVVLAEVEAGAGPPAALQAAAEAAPALSGPCRAAADAARAGGELGAELDRTPDLHALAHAWRVADAAGAPLADTLTGLCADLAAGTERGQAVSAALAGPRATAALLGVLPVLGLALGSGMGARPLHVLLGTAGGQAICCAGVVLDVLGLLWTNRLLRGAEAGPRGDGAVRRARARWFGSRLPPDGGLPFALDLAAAALRCGRDVANALRLAAPVLAPATAAQWRRVAGLIALGADPDQAWMSVGDDADLAPVAVAARRSAKSGARLAAAFSRLARDLRAEQRSVALARANRAGVLAMAPLGLCFLPAFVCIGIVPTIVGIASGVLDAVP